MASDRGLRHRSIPFATAAALLGLAACGGDAPAGQVAARVNGVEITIAELSEEARARGLALEKNPALRNALVQELVDRKLLVSEAEAQGLHRTPRHILAERRMRDILLGQQLLTGEESTQLAPDRLRAFIAANPSAFDRRLTAQADLISIGGPLPPALAAALASTTELAAAEVKLNAAGISFRRSQENWDSADPASPLWGGRLKASEGVMMVLPRGGETIVAVLSKVTPQPVPAGQQAAVARALVSRATAEQRMRQILEEAKAKAAISYQPGFGPESDGSPAAGTAQGQR